MNTALRAPTVKVSCHQCGHFRPAGDYFGRPTERGACLMSCATNLKALKGRACRRFQRRKANA